MTAIDGDEKSAFAAGLVMRIDVWPSEENPVLDGDRMQFAGAHADKGEPRFGVGLRDDDRPAFVALSLPQAQHGRMQELLPRMRPDSIAEHRVVVAPGKPIAPAVLLVSPARRQIGN